MFTFVLPVVITLVLVIGKLAIERLPAAIELVSEYVGR